jgi:hypothetical protein
MQPKQFIVDLNDPEDVAAKVAEGERILREIDQQLEGLTDLQREAQEWRANVEFLASKVAKDPPIDLELRNGNGHVLIEVKTNGNGQPRPGDLVVEIVNREGRIIRAKEVHELLAQEGHDLTPEQVSNALHYAAHDARKISAAEGRGMYAPRDYREPELTSQTAPSATGPTQAQPTDAAAM